eukprot:jgi/Chlat1/7049/Chrsp56S06718
MRPILCKGHERPLTFVKYNREGDLVFSCAKDHNPTAWYSDTGERIGTYKGHNGAVWCCDLTRDSSRLITGSADMTARLWDTETGTELARITMDTPLRSVEFSVGGKEVVITADPFMGTQSAIHIFRIENDSFVKNAPVLSMSGHVTRVNRALWGPLNKTIVSAGEDSTVRMWDAQTGKELLVRNDHTKSVSNITPSQDGTQFISASQDKTAKLWDFRTLDVLKTYVTDRPCNSAAISPIRDHVVLGGGQEASQVTTTSSRAGKFEAKFFHKVRVEIALELFASGGEDGYMRIHHFDADYFTMKF